MIVNFSIENFGSVKDKQTLSFEADKDRHLEDYYVIPVEKNLRLLKLGLIYGANASGKTTILKALDFLRDLVLEPAEKKSDSLSFEPFLFDPHTPNKNTLLSIELVKNNIRYHYEVEFNQQAIVREVLNFYHPKKASVFSRTTDLVKQLTEIKFGDKVIIDKTAEKSLETNTLWNSTVFGGFLKTNIEQSQLKEVTDWFKEYLSPLIFTGTNLNKFVTTRIDRSDISKETVIDILKKADFNISGIKIEKREEAIPDGLIEFLEKQAVTSPERINELKTKGKFTDITWQLEHTVNNKKYTLDFDKESHGTQRYYGFAGILTLLVKNSTAFSIDELEASLHPDLFVHFLLSFLVNAKQSQLIATTHNREILNNRDIFRNDAIWITDKSENTTTELYSLADFDTSVIRDTSNILNAYKSGKLGGVPHLSDYYIDLDNENP